MVIDEAMKPTEEKCIIIHVIQDDMEMLLGDEEAIIGTSGNDGHSNFLSALEEVGFVQTVPSLSYLRWTMMKALLCG